MLVSIIVAAVLSFVGFIFAIIATFAPFWVFDDGTFIGFFGTCVQETCFSSTSFLTVNVETKVCASFMIIGTFVLFVGSIVILRGIRRIDYDSLQLGGVITSLGGAAIFIGSLVFTKYWFTSQTPGHYSVSYGFAWTAALLGMGGGVLAKVAQRTVA